MEKEIAQLLLKANYVQLRTDPPFTYASGLTGPIYCDNRLLISNIEHREKIQAGFLKLIQENNLKIGQIAGMATAGIPHAAWLAQTLQLPLIYVRSKAKEHGKSQLVEGAPLTDAPTLVIEDLVNQGSSAVKAVQALKDCGVPLVGLLSIVSYEFPKAQQNLADLGCPLYSLTNFSSIIEQAYLSGFLNSEQRDLVNAWHAQAQ